MPGWQWLQLLGRAGDRLDAINPQVAARLARSLDRWRKYTPALQEKMRLALQQVAAAQALARCAGSHQQGAGQTEPLISFHIYKQGRPP
jgi:hypothetical protein